MPGAMEEGGQQGVDVDLKDGVGGGIAHFDTVENVGGRGESAGDGGALRCHCPPLRPRQHFLQTGSQKPNNILG